MTIFGPRWDALRLEDLRAFLDDADAEPLLWEAKGRNPRDPSKELDRHDLRKDMCAFANHHEAGYLILGASETNAGWVLDGVPIKNNDPPAWLEDVASGGLRPVPRIDVKPWKLDDGSWVAVVLVPPVDVAPCNSRGTVFERVSGKSKPVQNPERLAELYARGARAHAAAQTAARSAAELAFERGMSHGFRDPECVQVAIGLSMVGRVSDVGARLFTESTEEALRTAVDHHATALGSPHHQPACTGYRITCSRRHTSTNKGSRTPRRLALPYGTARPGYSS
jgi:hypothetical protein